MTLHFNMVFIRRPVLKPKQNWSHNTSSRSAKQNGITENGELQIRGEKFRLKIKLINQVRKMIKDFIKYNEIKLLNNKLKKTCFKQKLPKGNNVKDFWNYCKPYFTNKGICNDDRIILVEKNEILNKDSDISETFNKYFVNITKDLGIFDWGDRSFDHLNMFQ